MNGFLWLVVGIAIGFVGALTWPKWLAYLERRAAANKLKAATALLASIEAAAKTVAASKTIPVPVPPNPAGPTGA